MRHGRTRGALLAGVMVAIALAAPVGAITNGQPDDEEHPYVGQLFFYVPDEEDDRFDDPGSWFNCTGTLLSPTVVLTAGHCTFGTGLDGVATTEDGGWGGNDVWVSFEEEPDYTGIAAAPFIPDDNAAGTCRTATRSTRATPGTGAPPTRTRSTTTTCSTSTTRAW